MVRLSSPTSCTSNDDEGPSPFFRLLPDGCPEAPAGHPLSLRGLVGHLRHVLVSSPHGPRADDAVEALARLAGEGVAGASPDDWYGLLDPTTVEPLIDLDDPEATREKYYNLLMDRLEKHCGHPIR